MVCENKTCERM